MKTLPPGSILGILGGGQLGRMTALAAAKLGYRCHIFCPSTDEPAVEVSAFHTQAAFDDKEALKRFAAAVDAVTLEWENVPLAALELLEQHIGVYPSSKILRIAQDRVLEKNFAQSLGIATAAFTAIESVEELAAALQPATLPTILKSTRMGYDGKGQVKIEPGMSAAQAWAEMGSTAGILEAFVDFECEISVIVARGKAGVIAAYPPVRNLHRHHILAETHAPAGLDAALLAEAQAMATLLAEKLDLTGLLAIEMFVLKQPDSQGRRLAFNEMAPRPHNSGHWTMDACACSQFEQLVRATCGLPLGSVTPHSQAVMHNLIGDEWTRWPEFLADPSACLHLYGKKQSRPGRKMGHVNLLKGRW